MTEIPLPVVAVVTYPARTDMPPAQMRQLLEQAGPPYTRIAGLRRKYFMHRPGLAGGVYEWATRSHAEAFFDEAWYAAMTQRAGTRPQVTFFECSAIADGVGHRLHVYPAEPGG